MASCVGHYSGRPECRSISALLLEIRDHFCQLAPLELETIRSTVDTSRRV